MFTGIILDIDGCITGDIGNAFNLPKLQTLQDINEKSKNNVLYKEIPFITLNSGRPHAYCEAISQMIGNYNYFIFENGAGISKLDGINTHYTLDSRINQELLYKMEDIFQRVAEEFRGKRYYRQPNKQYAKTLLFEDYDPLRVSVFDFIEKTIKQENLPMYAEYGLNFINLNISGIHKGTGMELFKNHVDINYKNLVGIGDSKSDILFIEKCGYKACPSNADEKLKEICDYVSDFPDIEGTIDIINKIIGINQSLQGAKL
jgi:hydroxymethylpyrimidine pyrophosphatase-like HAD family hydrolase